MTQNLEIIKLLKRGATSEEIASFVNEQKKATYSQDFVTFMNEMLEKKHLKRKDIADRSGLSPDYTYKLLRGDKKTTERDYILAMCIVMDMSIGETQHALSIYPLPTLSFSDIRSQIIYHAIESHLGLHRLNELLERSGFPYIRVSPEMSHAEIEYNAPANVLVEKKDESVSKKKVYKVVDEEITAEQTGLAPIDLTYCGKKVLEDDAGNRLYVIGYYSSMGDMFAVFDDPEYENAVEEYESFEETLGSEFFPFFLEIDRDTDKKVMETLSVIDDTRNYGMRIGMGLYGGKREMFTEMFNQTNPAEREYFQVVDVDGNVTYSASRESYYMRYELGEVYEAYFGKNDVPQYYVYVSNLSDLPSEYANYRFIFKELEHELHRRLLEDDVPFIDDVDSGFKKEEMTIIAQRATAAHKAGKYEEGLTLLTELLNKLMEDPHNNIVGIIHTYNKIAITKGLLNDYDGMVDAYYRIIELSDNMDNEEFDEEGKRSCSIVAGDAAIHLAQDMQNKGKDDEALSYVQQSLAFLEGNCDEFSDWVSLYQAYAKYAFIIDDDPELSTDYSRRAVDVARDHDIGREPAYIKSLAILYNNHAHTLWNKLESEEAIIYYGLALETIEGAMAKGTIPMDEAIGLLEHVGRALNRIYCATNKEKESAKLIERLSKKDIIL